MEDIRDKETGEQVARFEEILLANGIADPVAEVVFKNPGLQGEGFASQAQYITVKFKNEDVKPLNLFAKLITKSPSQIEIMDEVKMFEKEANFLLKYGPAAQKLWQAKGGEGSLEMYPKCYYGDSRVIVMENLVLDKGYCMLDKIARQDFETAKFSLRTLATHHAVSYAMIQEEGGPDNFFRRFQYLDKEVFSHPQFPELMGPMFTHSLNANIGILENNSVEGREEALEFLKSFQNVSVIDIVFGNLKRDDNSDDLLVINHGDYWNNNMLFLKDKETDKIIRHLAIDFQITRYNTPALDLTYYFYTSVKPEVRTAHLRELLEFYLDVLLKVSKDMGHPINLTYEQLFHQYRKRISYGFWWSFCLTVGPGMLAMKDMDINTVDVNDWANVFNDLIKKWIAANPESATNIAKELVSVVAEYRSLALESQ